MPSSAGSFHVFSGNRTAGSSGAVRSFSGQGNEVWENANSARNIVPKSQSLATLHSSVGGSAAASPGIRSNSSLVASSRFAGGSSLVGNRRFSGGVNSPTVIQHLRGPFGSGFGRNRFGGGCWNCGNGFGGWGNRWGFGGGWGFGWPWLGFGFGFGDPFWYNPWWGVGPAYGYGYYDYPNSNVYSYPDSGYSAPDNYSAPPQQDNQDDQADSNANSSGDSNGNYNGNWVTPNGPSPSSAPNSGSLNVPVLIYLKSGAVYTVRDYWMVNGELHFILVNGVQNSINLEQVDLPRTNTENAKSGVTFIFKSEPSITPAAPDGSTMPPGASEPSPAPAPTQQIDAVPQPEART
jgi:hypothetical protein